MGHHTGRAQQTGGMTTESETPLQTGQDQILLRQANPLVVRNGKAQKGSVPSIGVKARHPF